jgi:fructokinase
MSVVPERPAKVLVCGEALIDLFACPVDPSGTSMIACTGGSPLNVATGIARLGTQAAFLGGISRDHFGEVIIKFATAEGIEMSLVKRTGRPTPLVTVATDPTGHPSYAFYTYETAEHDLTLDDLPSDLPETIDAIAMGSYALALEPVGTALLALAQREAQRRVISLDPNLRPALVGPLDRWRQRFESVAHCATIIKLSEEDFTLGWGADAQIETAVRCWLENGVRLVAMTRGASGAAVWWSGGKATFPAHAAEVIDAVGAGDSFHAALLARLAQRCLLDRKSLADLDRSAVEDVIRYANAAAALTCGCRGADMPRQADVEGALHAS